MYTTPGEKSDEEEHFFHELVRSVFDLDDLLAVNAGLHDLLDGLVDVFL